MIWQENETWDLHEGGLFLSLTLVRKSDGYTLTFHATSQSPWTSCRLAVSAGGFGYQFDGVVLMKSLDAHSLALELSEVQERLKVRLMSRYSERGRICAIPNLNVILRESCNEILELS